MRKISFIHIYCVRNTIKKKSIKYNKKFKKKLEISVFDIFLRVISL